jgi:hypothetical protein
MKRIIKFKKDYVHLINNKNDNYYSLCVPNRALTEDLSNYRITYESPILGKKKILENLRKFNF